jgi:alpha-tubulin suppressor-like RCC1 family protein
VTNWLAIAAGSGHRLAIGSDGQLYAWSPNNSFGQLGTGNTNRQSFPTLVASPPGVTNWTAVAAGANHSLGIGGDGLLYAWGSNSEKQSGTGSTGTGTNSTAPAKFLSPIQVLLPPGISSWSAVAAGLGHSLAIGNDCQLYAWGGNSGGELGIGSTLSQAVPTPVYGVSPLCGTPALAADSHNSRLSDGTFLIQFNTDLNRTYYVEYSSDAQVWKVAFPPVLGTGGPVQWIDDGPPKTDSSPADQTLRFYRVLVSP